ncbi:hypothetical protein CWATWH0401_4348 [Crocosphaera watsonii WH 0401]|uniref:Uncharacterized protein n=1 Tax=Crocosphaera watsonii WH 0401 TaxID=555881 RepID=T2JFK7_CROWT|nr:hypothetical protein CWATWH0401_4348 [Crocosphaera watsonii WH 0401]
MILSMFSVILVRLGGEFHYLFLGKDSVTDKNYLVITCYSKFK